MAVKELSVAVSHTNFRPVGEVLPPRVNQRTAHDREVVSQALRSETILRKVLITPEGGSAELSVVNVLSPYTNGMHVMLLDSSPKYRATPSELPDVVGNEAVKMAGRIVEVAEQMEGYNDAVCVGFNNSPTNYGRAEEAVGGMQSLTTKWHLHVWNRGPHDEKVAFAALDTDKKRFLQGDPLVKLGGELASHFVKTYDTFVVPDSHQVDNTGFRARLTTDLKTALQNPKFFTEFLKPLHKQLEAACADISGALTNFDYHGFKETLREGFEGEQTIVYDVLQAEPTLLPHALRLERAQELLVKGYPPTFVAKLRAYDAFFKASDKVEDTQRIRKGLGYALVLTQEKDQEYAELRIRPATLIGTSRGGVVEAQGYVTKRTEHVSEPAEAQEVNRQRLSLLRATLMAPHIANA